MDQYPFYQFFSKILENFMYNGLKSFVHKHNILSEAENGLRKMKSTETASQTFTESIQQAIDQRTRSGIFLDLT
jgi:hypothetical protein